jgi:hypothetical protein
MLGTPGSVFHSPRLAIADARIVDYGVKATEFVDLVGNGPRSGDGREVPRDGSLGSGRCQQGVTASTIIPPMQNNLMALLDQEPGRDQTEAVR